MSARTFEPDTRPRQDKPRRRWWAYFGVNSLALSILIHVLFGVGATYLIVEHLTARKHINFQASEPPAPQQVEHKVQLARRNNQESAPPDLKRIVTTDVSSITLPEPPDIPTPDVTTPSPMAGIDGTLGMGDGMGGGGGGGGGSGGGGGGNPLFGTEEGTGLIGTLYDFKQTPDGKPTDMATGKGALKAEIRLLQGFAKTWDLDQLTPYYKAPVVLKTPRIFIPKLAAVLCPRAFHVEDKVKPSRWIVIYHATIIPPRSGEFRFIGWADDLLLVRLDDRNVLDGSWNTEQIDPGANNPDREDVGPNPGYGPPMHCGRWFQMEAGTPMSLQILIGELPGGYSGFFLFIDEKANPSPKGDYPVFQVSDVDAPKPGRGMPATYTGKKMVFQTQKDSQ